MEMHKDLPVYFFKDQILWLDWLTSNYQQTEAIWIKFGKKNSGIQSITYEEAREGAIIYGWIDGLKNGYDEQFYLIRFTARRPKSKWSKINREIAEDLIQQGRMMPSGQKEVDTAKADGRWDAAYDSPSNMQIPDDFQQALDANPKALAFFKTINKTNRYAFLYRIHDAKKPETRQKRIHQFIEMLEKNELPYPNR